MHDFLVLWFWWIGNSSKTLTTVEYFAVFILGIREPCRVTVVVRGRLASHLAFVKTSCLKIKPPPNMVYVTFSFLLWFGKVVLVLSYLLFRYGSPFELKSLVRVAMFAWMLACVAMV